MSAPTVSQIMSAIETRLKTIDGLNTSAYVADQVNPPQAVVAVPDVPDYRETFGRGTVLLTFKVYLFIGAQVDSVGQASLADFVSWTGAKSIPLAIEGDRVQGVSALGGLVDDCAVVSFRNFTIEEVGVVGFYGGEFSVLVASPGV